MPRTLFRHFPMRNIYSSWYMFGLEAEYLSRIKRDDLFTSV